MPHISIHLSEQEKEQVETYANLQGHSLPNMIKTIIFERLFEEAMDVKLIREYETEEDKSTLSHNELKAMLGLA